MNSTVKPDYRLNWRQFLTYALLTSLCVYGSAWLNRLFFADRIPAIGRGIAVFLLLLVIYPVLAWKRHSLWVKSVTFRTWTLLAVCAAVFIVIVRILTTAVTHYFAG
jgi:hypothetical protein